MISLQHLKRLLIHTSNSKRKVWIDITKKRNIYLIHFSLFCFLFFFSVVLFNGKHLYELEGNHDGFIKSLLVVTQVPEDDKLGPSTIDQMLGKRSKNK